MSDPLTLTMEVVQDVNVRSEARVAKQTFVTSLKAGQTVEIDPNQRQEADGYIFRKSGQNWIAEKSTSGELYLLETLKAYPAAAPDQAPSATIQMKVIADVNTRSMPDTDNQYLLADAALSQGEFIEVNVNDKRAINDGYVWVKHSGGWSAQARIKDGKLYLVPLTAEEAAARQTASGQSQMGQVVDERYGPGFKSLIQQYPVRWEDLTHFYYFGNTLLAYKCGQAYNYHKYAQGLHAGLDFGNKNGALVYAGVQGKVVGTEAKSHQQMKVFVQSGDYYLIYQHISFIEGVGADMPVAPDTPIARVMPSQGEGGLDHLHFEVRYKKQSLILNPMWLMSDEMAQKLIQKYPPTGTRGFFERHGKWLDPFDQPIITRGGEVVVPRYGDFDERSIKYTC